MSMDFIAKNSVYNVAYLLLNTLFLLLITPIFINHLGTESYGIWVLASDVLGFLTIIDAGFNTAVIKFVSEYNAEDDTIAISETLTVVLGFYLVTGLVAGLGVAIMTPKLIQWFGVSNTLRSQARFAFFMSALSIIPSFIRRSLIGVPMAKLRYDWAAVLRLAWTVPHMGGLVIIVTLGGDLTDAMIWQAVVSWGAALLTAWVVIRMLNENVISWSWSWDRLKKIAKFSSFTALTSAGTTLFSRGDRLIVGSILGPSAAGLYAIAASIASRLNQLANSLTHTLMPVVSSKHEKDSTEVYSLFRRTTRALVLAVLGITSVAVFCAGWGLEFWLGETATGDFVILVRVTLIAYGLYSLNATAYHTLNGLGYPEINTFAVLGASLLVLGLDVVLLPNIGLIGAAVANFGYTAILISFIFVFRYFRRSVFLEIKELFALPFVVFIASMGVAYFTVNTLELAGTLILVVLLTLVFMVIGLVNEWALVKRWGMGVCRWILLRIGS